MEKYLINFCYNQLLSHQLRIIIAGRQIPFIGNNNNPIHNIIGPYADEAIIILKLLLNELLLLLSNVPNVHLSDERYKSYNIQNSNYLKSIFEILDYLTIIGHCLIEQHQDNNNNNNNMEEKGKDILDFAFHHFINDFLNGSLLLLLLLL